MGLTTGELKPLFEILRCDSNPTSPRLLTPEGCKCLKLVKQQSAEAHLNYINYHHLCFAPAFVQPNHVAVLEVLHTAYLESLRTFGRIPDKVIVPSNKEQLNWLQ